MIFFANNLDILLANNHKDYIFDKDIDLMDIKKFIYNRHHNKGNQVCIHELGIQNVRFDFISLNPYTHKIRIMEYKVSKNDFDSDHKWQNYLPWCNTFTFVTPLGLIDLDALPTGIGLLQMFKWQRRITRVNRWNIGAIWIRKPYGRILSIDRYYQMADMLLARIVQGRKDDFF